MKRAGHIGLLAALLATPCFPALADSQGSATGGTAGTQSTAAGCIDQGPTLTSGQQAALACDASNNLKVNVSAGSVIVNSQTPVAATVSSTGTVTSLVLKASPTSSTGGVKYFHAENGTATSGYCILYNSTTAPSTGALTPGSVLAFQLLPASGYCDWGARDVPPIAASTGAVVLLSSAATPFSYTTGTITGSIYGLAQ